MTAPGITPTPAPSPEAIKASFGFVGALADAIPELKEILDAAIAGQWTNDRFIMAVSASQWYRSNSDRVRQWITLQQVDPETARADHYRVQTEVYLTAWQHGIQLTDQQAYEVATWKLLNKDATDEALKNHLALRYFNPYIDWHQLTGAAAGFANQIQEIGRQYGWDDYTNYDDSRNWLGKLMRGEDTIEGFQRAMLDFAKVKYPGLHDQLLGGMSLQQIADPYLATYSQVLEMPKTAINWYEDPLVQRALQFVGQGETQSAGSMPMYEFEKTLRQDPRWRQTTNAIDSTAALIQKIGTDWGYYG